MRNLCSFLLLLLSTSLLAQVDQKVSAKEWAYYGQNFYGQIKSQKEISKESLYSILNGTHISTSGKFDSISGSCVGECYNHRTVGYDSARKILFGELFVQKDNSGLFVMDVYCGKIFHYAQVADISHMGSEVNIEHTWPQSKFNKSYDKGMQKSDMHHLYPTDSDANNKRASHEFGMNENSRDELNVQGCDMSKLIGAGEGLLFTPPSQHRGNVARSLFYFSVRYKLMISSSQEKVIRAWHDSDPVDAEEASRHEIISKYQSVRNPFIDHPELVGMIQDF